MKNPNRENSVKKASSIRKLKMKSAWLVLWHDMSYHGKEHETIIGLFSGRTNEKFIKEFVQANYLRCTGGIQGFMEAANGSSSSKNIVKKDNTLNTRFFAGTQNLIFARRVENLILEVNHEDRTETLYWNEIGEPIFENHHIIGYRDSEPKSYRRTIMKAIVDDTWEDDGWKK